MLTLSTYSLLTSINGKVEGARLLTDVNYVLTRNPLIINFNFWANFKDPLINIYLLNSKFGWSEEKENRQGQPLVSPWHTQFHTPVFLAINMHFLFHLYLDIHLILLLQFHFYLRATTKYYLGLIYAEKKYFFT
jgi:hypothetical protein